MTTNTDNNFLTDTKKMDDNLFNYIYDAMCWALEYMDEMYSDDKGRKQYEKLDNAVGKFYNWYNN